MTFAPKVICFYISAVYIIVLLSYYNSPMRYEKYVVTKAEIGSPERLEIIWEVIASTSEVPIDGQNPETYEWSSTFLGPSSASVMRPAHDVLQVGSIEFTEANFANSLKYFYELRNEDEIFEDDEVEDMKFAKVEMENFQVYFNDKIYPVHDYYL